MHRAPGRQRAAARNSSVRFFNHKGSGRRTGGGNNELHTRRRRRRGVHVAVKDHTAVTFGVTRHRHIGPIPCWGSEVWPNEIVATYISEN